MTEPKIKHAFIDAHFRIYGLGEDNIVYEYKPQTQQWVNIRRNIKFTT